MSLSKVMKLSFEYECEVIEFELKFSKRKTLGIEVRPPGIVKVTAPFGTSKERILSVVSEKGAWIASKMTKMKAISDQQNKILSYTNGSIITYLGRPYKLVISEDSQFDIPHIELKEEVLNIYTASSHEILIENAIEKWLSQMTRLHLENRIQHFQQFFQIKPSRVIIKAQKRRWGSCNTKRELRFNKACIKISEKALDYLVVHEMSHLIHMNHSNEFWAQVEAVMPDYKRAREELKQTVI